MNRLLKQALAGGGGVVVAETVQRAILAASRPRYEPWERPHRETSRTGS